MTFREIEELSPLPGSDYRDLDCGASCTACADASLRERDVVEVTGVIRVRATIEACASARVACAEECDRHAAHREHCRICADVCRRCKAACDEAPAF